MTNTEYHSWLRKAITQQEPTENCKISIDKLQNVRGTISRILKYIKHIKIGGEGSMQGNKLIRIK